MTGKRKQAVEWAIVLGLFSLLLINLAGWSLYTAVHDWVVIQLDGIGIADAIMQNLLIVVGCVVLLIIIAKMKLSKALTEVLN